MTYAKPEQPVLRTPRRRPTPWPRLLRNVLTRVAADSVREIAIVSGGPPLKGDSTPVPTNGGYKPVPHLRLPANDRVSQPGRRGLPPNQPGFLAAKIADSCPEA